MEKVIRDGKVAVLVSHGYGAGWYSWHGIEELLFHPKLVEMVEKGKAYSIDNQWIRKNLGSWDVSADGADDLVIYWLPVGTAFKIVEFDGNESLFTVESFDLVA